MAALALAGLVAAAATARAAAPAADDEDPLLTVPADTVVWEWLAGATPLPARRGDWRQYAAATSHALELGLRARQVEVGVDAERVVNLVAMQQHRRDDVFRARAVRRRARADDDGVGAEEEEIDEDTPLSDEDEADVEV